MGAGILYQYSNLCTSGRDYSQSSSAYLLLTSSFPTNPHRSASPVIQRAVIQRPVAVGCGEVCGPALARHCTPVPTAGGMKGADKWGGRAAQGARGGLLGTGKSAAVCRGREDI